MHNKQTYKIDNYSSLARYYDYLLGDYDSLKELWFSYFKKHSKGLKTLELACGTGDFSAILADFGFTVLASDISSEMIEVALKKYQNNHLSFQVLDMKSFNLEQRFDNIVCICDSVNYLNLDEFDLMLTHVYKHLNHGGIFFFDMHAIKRLNEFDDEYIEEGTVLECEYQFSILAQDHKLLTNFIFYQDGLVYHENHVQNVFEIDEIVNLMTKHNFKCQVYPDFIKDEKVLIVGEKI